MKTANANIEIQDEIKIKNNISAVEEIRKYAKQELDEAMAIENRIFQAICLFAVIDCFAQEDSNYDGGQRDTFCKFVLKYQNKYDYLENIEPITLFYDIEEHIDKAYKYPEFVDKHPDMEEVKPDLFEKEYEVNLESLGYIDEKSFDGIIRSSKAEELLRYIEKKKGKTVKEKLEKNHQMLNLIYKRRSKLVHEMSDLGMESKWDLERDTSEPFYRNMGRIYERNGEMVSDNIYELIIPNSMIYDLGLNCINNYLDFCLEEQKHPFENNCNFKRRVSKTWTDKPVQ